MGIEALNTYKLEDKVSNVSDIHYRDEDIVIAGNEDGEFKMVNMKTTKFMHSWKVQGAIERGNVRKVDTGRGRKVPCNFATFCKNHPQSVLMVADNIVMKFDPGELVADYFPSTVDFAVQHRNGEQCFTEYKKVVYEAEKEDH